MKDTENLRLDCTGDATYLVGFCLDPNKHRYNPSKVNLDRCRGVKGGKNLQHYPASLPNARIGRFEWGGQGFTRGARNITLDPHEGVSDVPVLRAELQDDAGNFQPSDVNLDERIQNRDGYMEFH